MSDETKSETKSEFATLDIEQVVKAVMGQVDEAALEPALNLLLKIIKNVLTSKDPKFRILNLSKPILQEKIGRFADCVRLLTVLGFKHDKDTNTLKLVDEHEGRLEHASLLLQENLFALEREEKSQETEDRRPAEPDYDLSQVRVILQQLRAQIEESVGKDSVDQCEAKLLSTLDALLKINSNLTSSSDAQFRNLDLAQTEFFVQGWSYALDYLRYLGFVQDQSGFKLEQEHKTKISRACSVLKRFIEEVTPTEEQLVQRQAQRKPPERNIQFFASTPVKNPQLESDFDRADASLLLQASAAHQKRLKEQFPDVIITRQRRAEEKAKTKRRYDKTLVRVLFNDINPDNQIVLQAYFSPYETIDALFTLVQAHLCNSSKSFYFLNPPETIEAPSTVIFDRSADVASPVVSPGFSTSGQARHPNSRLLGPPKKKEKKPATFHLAEKNTTPTFQDLKLVPAAALHFHWSDGSVVCNPLLGECYVHKRPLELPNIPKAINQAKEQEEKPPSQKTSQEDPQEKKRRLKEAALMRKMGFSK